MSTTSNPEDLMADRNGNENCLEGYACPRCQNHRKLFVYAIVRLEVFDDGTGDYTDPEFGDHSEATCPECNYSAKLAKFRLSPAE
jgi:hypothetical protein